MCPVDPNISLQILKGIYCMNFWGKLHWQVSSSCEMKNSLMINFAGGQRKKCRGVAISSSGTVDWDFQQNPSPHVLRNEGLCSSTYDTAFWVQEAACTEALYSYKKCQESPAFGFHYENHLSKGAADTGCLKSLCGYEALWPGRGLHMACQAWLGRMGRSEHPHSLESSGWDRPSGYCQDAAWGKANQWPRLGGATEICNGSQTS